MNHGTGPSRSQQNRSFWIALGVTVALFVVAPFIVEAWTADSNDSLRGWR